MVKRRSPGVILIGIGLLGASAPESCAMASPNSRALAAIVPGLLIGAPQDAGAPPGSVRGMVSDKEFDVPLDAVVVTIVETGQQVATNADGNFVFGQVPPGRYTLTFTKDGYVRQVRAEVVVSSGQLTDIDAALPGEFAEMEEFIVQDIPIGGTDAALLKLRLDSPSLLDSISADLMSRAGASDAASALRLVSGASVAEGKYAVIRGLPDRYVSSQMNGVRLPTADEDKRAVQLDQFPAAIIESIQVTKTFTPDQQGDASGGAVNLILKNIPDQITFDFKSQISFNSQAANRSDFLTYDGGGVSFWGDDASERAPQLDLLGQNWDGAAGVSRDDAPIDYKWSLSGGAKHEFDNGLKIGGFASLFYERDSAFFDNGVDDSYWVRTPGGPMVPETIQGTPEDGNFKTQLFDVTQGTESVQWGGLGTFGIEFADQQIGVTYLHTRIAEDTATLAEDTRGKAFFFPDDNPNDPTAPGNTPDNRQAAPYLRTETLEYTERTADTLQFNGRHKIPTSEFGVESFVTFLKPEIDWTIAMSSAELDQPDKRQFGSFWLPESFDPGFPPFIPSATLPPVHLPFKPAANFTLGNFQRIFKRIEEDSEQYSLNLKLPFTQWSDSEGYFKFGLFDDTVDRAFNQDTFSNFNDNSAQFLGDFDEFWSAQFPFEPHPITDGPPFVDVDYDGEQRISAWYGMADVPLTPWLNVIGGARFESTDIGIVNIPEENATWFPPGVSLPVALLLGDADVDFSQDDVLPSIGLVIKPLDKVTLRLSYAETIARQTFKELTPILQQEFLGGDVFIGNPELRMSSLENYDVRVDYTPFDDSLFSVSYFHKDVSDPIEYVQRLTSFTFTTPVNYPKGELRGIELEARQGLGPFWDRLQGLSLGANATFIDSEVTLSAEESAQFDLPNILAPMRTRDMTNAPEHLYNLYVTYDLEQTGSQFALFYTVQGDTLVAGAGTSNGNFVPNVYALEYGTLNLSFTQKLGKHLKFNFQVKNLTNPRIEEVYRSEHIGGDVLKTSYTRGIEYAVGLSAEFTF